MEPRAYTCPTTEEPWFAFENALTSERHCEMPPELTADTDLHYLLPGRTVHGLQSCSDAGFGMLSKVVSGTVARFGDLGATSAWLHQPMGACDDNPNTWKASYHQKRKVLALCPLTEPQQEPWRDLGTNHHPRPLCWWGQSFGIKQTSLLLPLASADGPSLPAQVQGLKRHPINPGETRGRTTQDRLCEG